MKGEDYAGIFILLFIGVAVVGSLVLLFLASSILLEVLRLTR